MKDDTGVSDEDRAYYDALIAGNVRLGDLPHVVERKLQAVADGRGQTLNPTPRLCGIALGRDSLKSLPDPDPKIEGVLDRGTVALLYGRWGSGKSFIALDWGASLATGRAWQGLETSCDRTLYVAAEGAFGLKGRVDAWETGWQTIIPDEALTILPQPINLTHAVQVGELRAFIEWGGYDNVFIDTLARCMVGADENSAKDCGVVVDNLTRIRESTPGGRGLVVGVHHTGKDGKTFRGSSVFEAGADTVYSVTSEGGVITLAREKRKDGPQFDEHSLFIDPITGTESAVISVHRGVDKPERADKLLSIFVQQFVHSGASKSELRLASEMPNATFHRALTDLLTSGELVNYGTDKRPFYKRRGQ